MHMILSILKIYLSVYKARSTTYGQVGQLTGRSRPTWPERPVYGLGGVCYFADLHNILFINYRFLSNFYVFWTIGLWVGLTAQVTNY